MSSLPNEILMQIFNHCSYSGKWISNSAVPVNLLAVSRRWRAVALDTPPLWQQINIKFKGTGDYRLLLAMFLTNSRGRKLDINVFRPSKEGRPRRFSYRQPKSLLKFIAREMGRCERLSGYFSISELRMLLSSSANGEYETHLPFLQELDLAADPRTLSTHFEPPLFLFSTLNPNLNTLKLKDLYFIAWNGRPHQILLECCPNLEFLSMTWSRSTSAPFPPLRIEHTKLHHLELRLETSEDNFRIHDNWTTKFRAPNLKHLSFTHPAGRLQYQCQSDAMVLMDNYFHIAPVAARISAVFLPVCVLLEDKDSMVRYMKLELRDNLQLLQVYEHRHCSEHELDQLAMKYDEFREAVETGSKINFRYDEGPVKLDDVRSECQNCCYEEHSYSGMSDFSLKKLRII